MLRHLNRLWFAVAACALSTPTVHGTPPGLESWLLVRSEAESVGSLSWERIAEAYLQSADHRIVGADEASSDPGTHRLVVGCPANQPLLNELLEYLEVEWNPKQRTLALPNGIEVPPSDGLVIVAPDPDGAGRLVLFTGADPDAVFRGFTVSVDLQTEGFVQVRGQAIHGRGALGKDAGLDRPLCLRVDREWIGWLDETDGWPERERHLRVATAMASHGGGLRNTFVGSGNLSNGDAWMLRVPELIERSRAVIRSTERLRGRDLEGEVSRAWERLTEQVGVNGPAPVVRLVLDLPEATNARTLGLDPLYGRPEVVLNLSALTGGLAFEIALYHELTHCLDFIRGQRLVDRAAREAVAMWFSQISVPKAGEAQILMWSNQQLQRAKQRRAELIAAFSAVAESTSTQAVGEWLTLGQQPNAVSGAPDRSGYFVAWCALRAWREANPKSGLRELLALRPDDLMGALR